MADNVPVTPGAGANIATDDVGGVQFQRVKLALGADGVNDGDVAGGNPIPTLDVAAALKALLSALTNPVSLDPTSGRLRVVLDPLGGAQTLGTVTTVTTVSTVTNLAQVGGTAANSTVADIMNLTYAQAIAGRVT